MCNLINEKWKGCDHKAQEILYQKKVRQRRRDQGLCLVCGRLPVEGKTRCQKCIDDARRRNKKCHDQRVIAGLCIQCGKTPPKEGHKICDKCLEIMCEKQSKEIKCCGCGDERDRGHKTRLCSKCMEERDLAKQNKTNSNTFMKKHYNEDEVFRLAHLIRTRTNHAVKKWLNDRHMTEPYKGDICFWAIIAHLGKPPGLYGRGNGFYTIHHIIPLRKLDLTDPVEWKIAVSYKNVRWELWENNYKIGEEWTEESEKLYKELKENKCYI